MENKTKPNFPKGGTFFSGNKKPEIIIDKKGNSYILEGNVRSGKNKAMKDLTKRLESFSHVVDQTSFTIAEFNLACKSFKNLAPTAEEVLQNIKKKPLIKVALS